MIKPYGLDTRCVSKKAVDILNIEKQRVEECLFHNLSQLFKTVVELSLEAKRGGAEIIFNKCTIIAARLDGYWDKLPKKLKPLNFLNGNYCALMYLEMLVNLYKKLWVKASQGSV